MILSILLFSLISFFCTLSSSHPNPDRSLNPEPTEWKIGSLSFQGHNDTVTSARFIFFQKPELPCKGVVSVWLILGNPVCLSAIAASNTRPNLNADGLICHSGTGNRGGAPAWSTCDEHVKTQKKLPETQSQWLRWRIFDIKEAEDKTASSTAQSSLQRSQSRPSKKVAAKLEIVQGVLHGMYDILI
jgi:hypothetical protein